MAHAPAMDLAVVHDSRLRELLADHRAAVGDFTARASRLSATAWLVPRAEGKWTPAEEVRHLILTYQAFIADLRGERRMRLKGTPWLRRIWRAVGLTWIMYRGRIPRAVRAPREVRPEPESGSRETLLDELASEIAAFETEFTSCWSARPNATVRHPFFGDLSLHQAIHLAAVHTRHHAAFLPDSRA